MDIGSCPERKNPWAHVEAWKLAFGVDPEAVLVLKLRITRRTKIVLRELNELIGEAKNIVLITDELSDEAIAALHHCADLYLSLHRSEGFGLNIYEALILGKTVIATNWSANAEYGPTFHNYRGNEFKLVRYRDWMGQYPQSFQWADPDVRHAAQQLREARVALQQGGLE